MPDNPKADALEILERMRQTLGIMENQLVVVKTTLQAIEEDAVHALRLAEHIVAESEKTK